MVHEIPRGRIFPRLPRRHLFQKWDQLHSNLKLSSGVQIFLVLVQSTKRLRLILSEQCSACNTHAAVDFLSLFALFQPLLLHLLLHVLCLDVSHFETTLARIRRPTPTLESNSNTHSRVCGVDDVETLNEFILSHIRTFSI